MSFKKRQIMNNVWFHFISTYSQYSEVLIGLCQTTSNLPPNSSNRACFIRLLPSLVPSARRKKASKNWCESPMKCFAAQSKLRLSFQMNIKPK